jgi:hypothetical protein
MSKLISLKRAMLIADLEYLVGNNCYNPKIQNYGAHGIYEGEGRSIRYPLTTLNEEVDCHFTREYFPCLKPFPTPD